MTDTDIPGQTMSFGQTDADGAPDDAALRETIETEILQNAIARIRAQRQTEATHTLRVKSDPAPSSLTRPNTTGLVNRAEPLCVRVTGGLSWVMIVAGGFVAVTCWAQPHLLAVPAGIRYWVGGGALLAGVAGWAILGTIAAVYRRLNHP